MRILLPDDARQCRKCQTDLTLLTDYVSHLRVGLTQAEACTRAIVVTDGIFSMRGDHAPLDRIMALARRHDGAFAENAIVVVDDSHGVGAFGATARYALGGRAVGAAREGEAGPGALIINRGSGGGKAERFDLAGEAHRRGIATTFLEPGDDLVALAERAIDAGAQMVAQKGMLVNRVVIPSPRPELLTEMI